MPNRIVKHEETIESYRFQLPFYDQRRPVDMSRSISELSTTELDLLIQRLQAENVAADLIQKLQRYNQGKRMYDDSVVLSPIAVTTPVNQLYHHGILGMKWGVRRFQNPDGTRTTAGKVRDRQNESDRQSEDHMQSRNAQQRGVKTLSNSELRQLNERLQLERTLSELTTAASKRNESFGSKILKSIGERSLTEAGSYLATGLLKSLVADPMLNTAKKKGG